MNQQKNQLHRTNTQVSLIKYCATFLRFVLHSFLLFKMQPLIISSKVGKNYGRNVKSWLYWTKKYLLQT